MDIPEVVILRLPMYVRALTEIEKAGSNVVSSQDLGEFLHITPAQIRKDLSYFGRFGRQGRGYNVNYLLTELKLVLGLDRQWKTCLIGVGRLGRAIVRYPGFAPEGFDIIAAFDADPKLFAKPLGKDLAVRPMTELCQTIKASDISIAIVAVPSAHAQEVIDQLVECGIKAILNYAPIAPFAPAEVKVRNVDPTMALQSMTYYLRFSEEEAGKSKGKKRSSQKKRVKV